MLYFGCSIFNLFRNNNDDDRHHHYYYDRFYLLSHSDKVEKRTLKQFTQTHTHSEREREREVGAGNGGILNSQEPIL